MWSQGGAALRQIMNLLHWGRGNASPRQIPAWEGGQGPTTEVGVRLTRWEHMNSHGRECGVRKMMTAEDKAFGDTHSWGAGRERIQEEMEQQERGMVPLFSRAAPPLFPPLFSHQLGQTGLKGRSWSCPAS